LKNNYRFNRSNAISFLRQIFPDGAFWKFLFSIHIIHFSSSELDDEIRSKMMIEQVIISSEKIFYFLISVLIFIFIQILIPEIEIKSQ
jgi:hypothetical protein